MLARHAESMFWAGRYIERAESTARMLNVTYHNELETVSGGDPEPWRDLLEILHLNEPFDESGREATANSVSQFLVFGSDNPGTIRGNVTAARENLRSVRELISTEMWEAVNNFHLQIAARDLEGEVIEEPHALYAFVRTQCQTLAGTAQETMSRDEAWQFLTLGWMLERSIMTARLLSIRYSELVDDSQDVFRDWLSTLKSASGSEAFRRKYKGSMNPADVVAFLLLSAQFPRSVLYGIVSAERCLERIEMRPENRSRPQRLLGALRAEVEFLDIEEVLEGDLTGLLSKLEDEIRQVSEAISVTYFRSTEELPIHVLDPAAVRG